MRRAAGRQRQAAPHVNNHAHLFSSPRRRVYREEHGHTLVPQLSCPLGVWVKEQRNNYRRMKRGVQSPMTAEKALRLTEIGFHFDAERFKGRNRQVE